MRRLALTLALLSLLGLLSAARVGVVRRSAESRLAAARLATATLDYHGQQLTRVRLRDEVIESRVAVVHQAPDRTRLEYLDGQLAGIVLVTRGDEQWRYDPELNSTQRLSAPSPLPVSLQGYRVRAGAGPAVAGRLTDLIEISGQRGERMFWLDRETNLVLATRIRHDDFRTETRFTEVTFGPPAKPVRFAPPAGATVAGAEACSLSACSRKLGFPVREPGWRPPGYELTGAWLYDCPCGCGMTSAQLVYGDGVGWISLFYVDRREADCVISEACCRKGEHHDRCVGMRTVGLGVVSRVDRQPVIVAVGDARNADLARMVESVP